MINARCGDGYLFHKWRPFGGKLGVARRDYVCERCALWATGIAVFADGIRAEHVARKYKIGKYFDPVKCADLDCKGHIRLGEICE